MAATLNIDAGDVNAGTKLSNLEVELQVQASIGVGTVPR